MIHILLLICTLLPLFANAYLGGELEMKVSNIDSHGIFLRGNIIYHLTSDKNPNKDATWVFEVEYHNILYLPSPPKINDFVDFSQKVPVSLIVSSSSSTEASDIQVQASYLSSWLNISPKKQSLKQNSNDDKSDDEQLSQSQYIVQLRVDTTIDFSSFAYDDTVWIYLNTYLPLRKSIPYTLINDIIVTSSFDYTAVDSQASKSITVSKDTFSDTVSEQFHPELLQRAWLNIPPAQLNTTTQKYAWSLSLHIENPYFQASDQFTRLMLNSPSHGEALSMLCPDFNRKISCNVNGHFVAVDCYPYDDQIHIQYPLYKNTTIDIECDNVGFEISKKQLVQNVPLVVSIVISNDRFLATHQREYQFLDELTLQ